MERIASASVEIGPCHANNIIRESNDYKYDCQFLPCECVSCFYEYPVKIMLPSNATDSRCQWLYPINFGGGLVEGDDINICVTVQEKCCVVWTTLSFPKVYHCTSGKTIKQELKYNVGTGSLLCILPDPLVCYKQASYIQTQIVNLATDASLVLLDWFTSGRYISGERWAFAGLKTTTTVFINKALAFKEAQNLKNTPFLTVEKSMKSFNIFGICMLIGPCIENLSQAILSQLGKCGSYGEKQRSDLLFAASPFYRNGCVIRFAAKSVVEAKRQIEDLLNPLFDMIGGNPLENK